MDHALQDQIQNAIDALVASGTETGLQVAVIGRDHVLVDAVSGTARPETGAPVTSDTLFFAASTAKGVASALAHVLVDRGDLTDDLHLVDVWPEFGRHGKAAVTLRQVLLHTAGLPAVPRGTTVEDLCNWEHMVEALADSELWWEPGSRFGYHALTFGFLLGETLRRVTGEPIGDLLRSVLTGPLGIASDVYFGVPAEHLDRVATPVAPTGPDSDDGPPPGSPADRAVPAAVRPDAAFASRTDVLTADIPSLGTMTALGVAQLYAALLDEGPRRQLVSPGRRTAMAAVAFRGLDTVMGIPVTWGYGFVPTRPIGTSRVGSTFGMIGANGTAAYADIDSGLAVALMRNRFAGGDLTALETVDRIVAAACDHPREDHA